MDFFKLDKTNKKLAGVCSGLANYFNFDVTLIRAAFIVLTLLTGFVPFALFYIIVALIAPEEEVNLEDFGIHGG